MEWMRTTNHPKNRPLAPVLLLLLLFDVARAFLRSYIDCSTSGDGVDHIGFNSPFTWNTYLLDYPVCVRA